MKKGIMYNLKTAMDLLKGFHNHLYELDKINEDALANASSLLDISEFQIFQLAHENWYGDEGDIKYLEKCFFLYLYQENLPLWVRHYARSIVSKNKKGELNPHSLQYHKYDPEGVEPLPKSSKLGTVLGLLIMLFTLLGLYMHMLYTFLTNYK